MLSRRQFAGALAVGASTIALSACGSVFNADGSLTSSGAAFLKTVASAAQAIASGLGGAVLTGLENAVGISIPADVMANFTGGLSALSTIASNLGTASQATAADLITKIGTYVSAVLSAGSKILSIPGVSALPFAGLISTGLAVASGLVPFFVQAAEYVQGIVNAPPSATTTVTTPAPATAAHRFGAIPAGVHTVQDAIASLNRLSPIAAQ